MTEMFDTYMREACGTFDLVHDKIESMMMEAESQKSIHYKEAELKVMQENGTDDDLSYYYEAIQKMNEEIAEKVYEKVGQNIGAFFNSIGTKIGYIFSKNEYKTTIQELEKSIKTFPLIGKKKIAVENYPAEQKCCDSYLAKLTVLKSKLNGKQSVEASEIRDLMNKFDEEHKKLTGVGNAEAITLTAAITLLKQLTTELARNSSKWQKECEKFVKGVKDQKNGVAVQLSNAYTKIMKTKIEDLLRCIKTLISSIKSATKSASKSKEDIKEDQKKDASMNEATDPRILAARQRVQSSYDKRVSDIQSERERIEAEKRALMGNKVTKVDEEGEEDMPAEDPAVAIDGSDPWAPVMNGLIDTDTDECGTNCESTNESVAFEDILARLTGEESVSENTGIDDDYDKIFRELLGESETGSRESNYPIEKRPSTSSLLSSLNSQVQAEPEFKSKNPSYQPNSLHALESFEEDGESTDSVFESLLARVQNLG